MNVEFSNYRKRTVNGLRTRFAPKSRINQGFVSMVPWINVLLLLFMFLFLDSKLMIQPGVVVDLPKADFSGGMRSGLVLVVNHAAGSGDEMVFFNDSRYMLKSEADMEVLKSELQKVVRERAPTGMIIHADRNVGHGTMMLIYGIAESVGVKKVCMSTKEI